MNSKRLNTEELHGALLLMLHEFHNFCEKYHISYFLAFGTLIGAVRHNGFIPWDDDVDIIVPRPDFERLITFEKINGRYDIVSNKNPNGYYHPFLHANITDNYTYMDEHDMVIPTGKGVFLDIFPLDGLPDKRGMIRKHCKQLQIMKAILGYTVSVRVDKKTHNLIEIMKDGVRFICRHTIPPQKLITAIQNKAMRYNYASSNYVAVSASMPTVLSYDHFVFKKDLYRPIKHVFEGYNLIIPEGYDAILTSLYGDYMTPPPIDKRTLKHDIDYYWKVTP